MKPLLNTCIPTLILLAPGVTAGVQEAGSAPAAVEEALPEARTIIDRHVEATGLGKVLATTTSSRVKGRIEIVGQGIEGPMEVLTRKPNLRLIQIEMTSIGTLREGFDGEIGWSARPGMGATLQEGTKLLQAAMDANYTAALKHPVHYERLQTLGRSDFRGKSCWKVELVLKPLDGMDAEATRVARTSHDYYDVETGLLAGTERRVASPTGDAAVVVIPSDYKKLGARLVATTITQEVGPQQIKLITESISYDDVEAAAFTLPADVQVLVDARDAAASDEAE